MRAPVRDDRRRDSREAGNAYPGFGRDRLIDQTARSVDEGDARRVTAEPVSGRNPGDMFFPSNQRMPDHILTAR